MIIIVCDKNCELTSYDFYPLIPLMMTEPYPELKYFQEFLVDKIYEIIQKHEAPQSVEFKADRVILVSDMKVIRIIQKLIFSSDESWVSPDIFKIITQEADEVEQVTTFDKCGSLLSTNVVKYFRPVQVAEIMKMNGVEPTKVGFFNTVCIE